MEYPDTKPSTRQKGSSGEDQAVDYLLTLGYAIVNRNYQTRDGEIDCVAMTPDKTVVFVEVKCAGGMSRGNPVFWVTPAKQRQIIRMARRYLSDHNYTSQPCRFDVITIMAGKLDHIKNAFLA
jgi:putative endonuclease